jgi:hypothetical protein
MAKAEQISVPARRNEIPRGVKMFKILPDDSSNINHGAALLQTWLSHPMFQNLPRT